MRGIWRSLDLAADEVVRARFLQAGPAAQLEADMAVNGQYDNPGPMFGGGSYTSTGAAGTGGASGSPPGAMDVAVTDPTGSARISAIGSHAVSMAGQTREGFSGVDVTTTGAGQGSTIARHPNSTARA
jgi:hypothetical protein